MYRRFVYGLKHCRQLLFVLALLSVVSFLSFRGSKEPRARVATYYDRQMDSLLASLSRFRQAVGASKSKDTLIERFFECRNAYKSVELFVDLFTPQKSRLLNGPDLLKIDEENPADSMKPHGLQVIEGILYAEAIDKQRLAAETDVLIRDVRSLRNDPDRVYYFSDDRIWMAMRLGVYRIVSLGITGFDAPLSYHALPEARSVLASVKQVVGYYRQDISDTACLRGYRLIQKADAYLTSHHDFNTFDRLEFIREYIDPLSVWLTNCSLRAGFINGSERGPVNPYAGYLFAADIIDRSFFSPNDNFKVSPERVALGKKLFYDPILSGDGSRSCASCHQPNKAFTDGLPKPMDVTGTRQLLRNTPTLWNAALQTAQFYDSRTKKLENQLSAVVHNTDEMNGSLRGSIPGLAADSNYHRLFSQAYPAEVEQITEYNIANAISSYVRTLISFHSRFDRYIRRETDSFTQSERNGFNLFMGKAKCGTCHYAPLFNGLTPPGYADTESETLGVPASDDPHPQLDPDKGRAAFTRHPFHQYSFRTSTVRNVALTAPYMHNGAFTTLDAVLDFYNDGGGAGRGIDLPTQTLPSEKLGLTKKEMKAIIAFLQTLTDTTAAP